MSAELKAEEALTRNAKRRIPATSTFATVAGRVLPMGPPALGLAAFFRSSSLAAGRGTPKDPSSPGLAPVEGGAAVAEVRKSRSPEQGLESTSPATKRDAGTSASA